MTDSATLCFICTAKLNIQMHVHIEWYTWYGYAMEYHMHSVEMHTNSIFHTHTHETHQHFEDIKKWWRWSICCLPLLNAACAPSESNLLFANMLFRRKFYLRIRGWWNGRIDIYCHVTDCYHPYKTNPNQTNIVICYFCISFPSIRWTLTAYASVLST